MINYSNMKMLLESITEQVLLRGLNDTTPNVKMTALSHKNATEQMLLHGLNDTNPNVKVAALSHPKATKKMLLKGLDNTYNYIRDLAKNKLLQMKDAPQG